MTRAFVFLVLFAGCSHGRGLKADPPDPMVEWNAALAVVERLGLSPARADKVTGHLETAWSAPEKDGRRFRLVIDIEGRDLRVVRFSDPPSQEVREAGVEAEIAKTIKARGGPFEGRP